MDAKKNGKTVIDISKKIQEIMVRNIVQITLGEDINDELIEFNMKESNGGYTFRGVKLSEAMKECID